MEIGKQYNVHILKRNNIRLQTPILFTGECFHLENKHAEFIDVLTQNVRVVEVDNCDSCVPKENRSGPVKNN
jgi:hypothetical protein